ncbi:MAG: carbamoyltransferase HypF [Acidobacteriota bacterium]
MTATAFDIRVRGVVQGVGFRPFVYRLARANALAGWVLNGDEGVQIHLEGAEASVRTFLQSLETEGPPAAAIAGIRVQPALPAGLNGFTIRESLGAGRPTVRVSPDLPVCDACLAELLDPAERRYRYPYVNCTNCGPRYSVIERLPYDRANTTMREWPLDAWCEGQYHAPGDRRFHAQPIACPACGPHFQLRQGDRVTDGDDASVARAVELLNAGAILAVKGLGGYHLACDARNPMAVQVLRERKYRKEKPFALMVETVEAAHRLVELSPEAESLLLSAARPIVLARARVLLEGVAPDQDDLGVMLPYAPLHYLLFAAGAPAVLVMTSANRSSEPIAYKDDEAIARLDGIADAFLMGQRPIARRIEDSVARAGVMGPMILRRSRGYAPGAVATLPSSRPILAVGADLKNSVTLVVDGQAFVSQHIGDLDQYPCREAFQETIRDLSEMYQIPCGSFAVAHDLHPQYVSTLEALDLEGGSTCAVQHHRAHIASVLAEREAWDERVIGVSFDGTGYGDDGTIWGGEFFAGSLSGGFERVLHLRPAALPGGDAAARFPAQSAAGFLSQMDHLPDLIAPPFCFPERYAKARRLVDSEIRLFVTTSVGRLFDAAAALLGFTREVTFEGQAAMWLEQLARGARSNRSYAFPVEGNTLDFRPLLAGMISDRLRGRDPAKIARDFQFAIAAGVSAAVLRLCEEQAANICVVSGGVFQNELLLEDLKTLLAPSRVRVWTNSLVPPNDGGISLGQAAIAAFAQTGVRHA